MTFKELDIAHSYISQGDNNIADSFLNPVLKCAKEYKRSVGFFSSGVLDTIMDGMIALVRNGGKVKLIASPKLSEADADAIKLGYEERRKKIEDIFSRDFAEEVSKLSDKHLQILYDLIRNLD